MRLEIYRYLLERKPLEDGCYLHGPYSESWDESLDTQTPQVEESISVHQQLARARRYPSILGVNHQIYFEAFPVLYPRPGVIDPSKGTWKYISPKACNGAETDMAMYDIYYDPDLPLDIMKPPKLARFSKIALFFSIEATLDWMYDEENGKLPIEVQQQLTEDLRSSKLIEDFVEQLAGCSWVEHVDIEMRLWARFAVEQDDTDSNFPPEEWAAELDARKKIWYKGDIQVADFFQTSGFLAPLRTVSNVESWCIELRVESMFQKDGQSPEHEKMTLDLRNGTTRIR